MDKKPCPTVTFFRQVAEGKAIQRGPDGGFLVPRHLYSHFFDHKDFASPDAGDVSPPAPGTRVWALAPLNNSYLLADDEDASRVTMTALIEMICKKVPRQVLRFVPVELESSDAALYKTATGKLMSAFERDEVVFRLSLRMPDIQQDVATNTRLGAEVTRPQVENVK
jgi:hypothetical protein